MNELFPSIYSWVGSTLGGGAIVLLAAWLLMRGVPSPARKHAIAVWSLCAALIVPVLALLPSWWRLPALPEFAFPETAAQSSTANSEDPNESAAIDDSMPSPTAYVFVTPIAPGTFLPTVPIADRDATRNETSEATSPSAPVPLAASVDWRPAAAGVYAVVTGVLLLHWLIAHVAIWRLVRRSRPAGGRLLQEFADLTRGLNRPPRLRIACGLRVPVCFGLFRPTIVVPQDLAGCNDRRILRWILVHELAHLAHGDAWACFAAGLAQALYWPVPWFWALRRQLRWNQEHLADAAAAESCKRPEDYAAFLVELSRSLAGGRTRRFAAASAVLGNSSDLFRRIDMLLKSRIENRCPRRWSWGLAAGFIALAVVLTGVGTQRPTLAAPALPDDSAKVDDKKDAPKKDADAPKKDSKNDNVPKVKPFPGARPRPLGDDNPLVPEDYRKMMQQMMEEMMQRMMQQPNFGGGFAVPGFPGQAGRGNARFGVVVEKPSPALVEQLDLPKDQGLLINDVTTDSAAAKAGVKAHDILLEIAGKPVANDAAAFRKQLLDIKADTAVDAVVMRKGKRETIKGIKLPEAKSEVEGPQFPGIRIRPGAIEVPPIPVPPIPIPAPGFEEGANVNSLSVQINNDEFTIRANRGGRTFDIKGSLDDEAVVVSSVTIRDGEETVTAKSVDKLPENYRNEVKELLKSVHVKKK